MRADEFEDRLLHQLDYVLLQEGYLNNVEGQIEKISQPRLEVNSETLTKTLNELADVEMETEDAFKLHARTSDSSMDDIFRQRLKRLQDKKKQAEDQIIILRNQIQNEILPSEQRRVIENNLNEFKKMRGGANRLMLKRLIKRVVESIVVFPERLALRYWASNDTRDERHPQKRQKAPDLSSGASVLNFPANRSAAFSSTPTAVCDQGVSGSSIRKNGRAGGIRTRDPLVPNQVRYQLRYGSTLKLRAYK